jgi:hypothetical protein
LATAAAVRHAPAPPLFRLLGWLAVQAHVVVGRACTVQMGHVGTVLLGYRWIRPDGCGNPFHFLIYIQFVTSCKICANLNSTQKSVKRILLDRSGSVLGYKNIK